LSRLFEVTTAVGVLCACLAPNGPVRADDLEARDRLVRVQHAIDAFASDAHQARLSSGVALSSLAAATFVPGVFLERRRDSDLQLLGVGFVIAGSIQLAMSPLFLIPTPLEKIQAQLSQGMANGVSAQALANRIETDLCEAAARKSANRPYTGGTLLSLGAASFATGMTFLFMQPGVAGMGARTQHIWGAALVGVGTPFAQLGIRTILQRSPEEAAWISYRTGSSGSTLACQDKSLSLAPTNGGIIGADGVRHPDPSLRSMGHDE
jgi:hypothetical protein